MAKIDFLILDGARRELLQVLSSSPPSSCRHSFGGISFIGRGWWWTTAGKFNEGKNSTFLNKKEDTSYMLDIIKILKNMLIDISARIYKALKFGSYEKTFCEFE